ncbi:ABC transporter permease [Chondromyces crocatus]|uniref:Peptide ABC transporter permease n=1 Tax=Chondromyces crocatus TaxID=52 RepID=A0A0K1EH83_CHOCO|nr:ABC transporter permease subunit [Chondromyces crocatus]AKT40042.1 peptide ABC transporter permease [Chondromyces crocatus]
MIGFIVKRLLVILPTLLLVATVAFVMMRFVPGGPFDQERAVPIEVERALRAKYHLDDPLAKQYGDWLWALVSRGDLGPAFKYPNRTVNEIIALSLPVSMQLGVLAMIFALLVGVPLGVVGAIRQNTWKDTLAMATAMVGVSVPRFVLAPLLILVFSLSLYWFPVARWETWRHMVLPVVCAGLPMAAYLARLTRGGMLEVIRSDFVRTARAKGLSERRVILGHALRGGMLPVVSYLGPGFSHLLVGSLVVEKIFNIPGMGRYFVEAAMNRDYNLVLGVMLVYGVLLMVFNAVVDVAYAFIDPRVELR